MIFVRPWYRWTSIVPRTTSRRYTPVAGSTSVSSEQATAEYCYSLLRKYDRPSYTLLPFVPPQTRPLYLALHALNTTTALIPSTTHSPMIGSMRLSFWRNGITSTFNGAPPTGEPILRLLSSVLTTLSQHPSAPHPPLTKSFLTRLLSAREAALENRPYPTLSDLESYAENTYSSLLYLLLESLPLRSLPADHLASHIGKAAGIAAVLRGIPLLAFPGPARDHSAQTAFSGTSGGHQQGAVLLPLDVMARHGVVEEDVLRQGGAGPGLSDAVFEVATRANDHLITAREMLRSIRAGKGAGHEFEEQGRWEEGRVYEEGNPAMDVERAFPVVFGQAVATGLWLGRLEKAGFDVFHEGLRRREWRLPWRAWWAFRRRAF